jgi:hypothetical protein
VRALVLIGRVVAALARFAGQDHQFPRHVRPSPGPPVFRPSYTLRDIPPSGGPQHTRRDVATRARGLSTVCAGSYSRPLAPAPADKKRNSHSATNGENRNMPSWPQDFFLPLPRKAVADFGWRRPPGEPMLAPWRLPESASDTTCTAW